MLRPIRCCYAILALTVLDQRLVLGQASPKNDYSKESVVVEQLYKELIFNADGTWQVEQTSALRVQSDAGVQQFGVLSFPYERGAETVTPVYVRVKKASGDMVETPEGNIQDVSSEVTRVAPMYSDLREKQIPVKALGVGDTLEFKVRTVRTKPAIAGQFWHSHNFTKSGAVVLDERLTFSVPAAKYVKISSPKNKPEVRDEGDRRIYSWKSSQLEPTPQDSEKAKKTEAPKEPEDKYPSVQLTTFKSWEDVGQWYAELQAPRLEVSPAIQAKAAELTKNLTSRVEKERALYNFVSTKIHYVSLSFGTGKYQPHAAGEVLDNEYGDCKDKHTLFSALLKAAGIESYAVLISAGWKLDDTTPSPAQFNHVITVIPDGNEMVWLDTTPEIAPFGLLMPVLRDEKALVIPNGRPALVATTPAGAPFESMQNLSVQGALDEEGTFTGRFDMVSRGDEEVVWRSAFHQTSPVQWRDLMQGVVRMMGFAGTVSNVEADNPNDLDKPFHYSFDYNRPTYSDWENKRISPPLFPMVTTAGDQKPSEAFPMGLPGKYHFYADIKLPAEYRPELPPEAVSHNTFSDFVAKYSFENGVFRSDRTLTIKRGKLEPAEWDAYTKFVKVITDDHIQMTPLVSGTLSAAPIGEGSGKSNAEAQELLQKAASAGQRRDFVEALEDLKLAERANPDQAGLWGLYGGVYANQNQFDKAVAAYKKEIQLHKGPAPVYILLAFAQERIGEKAAALETAREAVKAFPGDANAIASLSYRLVNGKRYEELATLLKPWLEKHDDRTLQSMMGDALLRTGKKEEGEAMLRKSVEQGEEVWLNNAAYSLADTRVDLALAKDLAEKAVRAAEEKTAKIALPNVSKEEIGEMLSLASFWDTLGWVYFQTGDFEKAEKYLEAAWLLSERGAVADHVGELYAKQGKQQAAIHSWQLALAADSQLEAAREHLRAAGAPVAPRPVVGAHAVNTPQEELSQIRTVPVGTLPKQTATAEFYVVFQAGQVPQVQYLSGSELLRQAGEALGKAEYKVKFPDDGPERIVRRGILSCSAVTTPSCHFVMLEPGAVAAGRE